MRAIVVNPDTREPYSQFKEDAFADLKLDVSPLYTDSAVIVLERDGTTRILHQGADLDFTDSYLFVNSWKVNGIQSKHMVSLLSSLWAEKGFPQSNEGYQAHDGYTRKTNQMVRYAAHNIPIPKTVLFARTAYFNASESILNEMAFPCILKRDGSMGKYVWKVESRDELEDLLTNTITDDGRVVMLQEYIPSDFDVRVIVFRDRIIGAIKRSSQSGFKHNISTGGTASEFKMTPELEELALKGIAANKMEYGGLDIIFDGDQPLVLEINRRPGISLESGFRSVYKKSVEEEVLRIIDEL